MGVPLMVAGVAGGLLQAAGTLSSGLAASESYAYKAQVAANNAAIEKQKAVMDMQAGEVAATNQGLKTRAKVAAEKTMQGAAGIDVNSGSAVDVRAGSAELGMLDALTVRSNAAKKAWSDEVNAQNMEAQSTLDKAASDSAETGAYLGAAGSLLSSASTVGGNYAKWQNSFGSKAVGDATIGGVY